MPSPTPRIRPKKRGWLAALGVNSLFLSILLHVSFGVVATYLIVEHFQKKHVNFHAMAPPSQHVEVEHKVQLAKRNNVESAPPDLKRIVTTAISPITLPDVPVVPQNTEITPTTMSGVDGEIGSGMGSGLGGGSGGGEGSPLFGAPDGTGLEGHLYDLKQTHGRAPTQMTPQKYHDVIIKFIHSDWDLSVLEPYYKCPKVLKTTSIFIPTIHADDGPKAFHVENEVKPRMYVVLYTGTAIVPEDGVYHFVGVGDDILVVRIDGRTVLDGCLQPVDNGLREEEKKYPILSQAFKPSNSADSFLYVGRSVPLQAGQQVSLEVLIGEQPGGWSNYFLLIQRNESTYPTQSNKTPLLPIFQLIPNPIHPQGNYPPFLSTPAPWQVGNGENPLSN